jgi:hypothetical protein
LRFEGLRNVILELLNAIVMVTVTLCDLSIGNVSIQDGTVSCNGETGKPHHSLFRITGSGVSVLVANARVDITRAGATLSDSFMIVGSSVTLTVAQASSVRGIVCDMANVTLQAEDDLSSALNSTGRDSLPGIGAPTGGWCESITVLNGSMAVQGGPDAAGIGTGAINSGGNANVHTIAIKNGNITAKGGSSGGAGIGTGRRLGGGECEC